MTAVAVTTGLLLAFVWYGSVGHSAVDAMASAPPDRARLAAASPHRGSVGGDAAASHRLIPGIQVPAPRPPAQKGIVLGLYSEDPGWDYQPLLQEIHQTGANYVSIVVAYYLADIHAVRITRHPRYSAPDSVLVRTIRQAHRLGLRVMLFPILRVLYKPTPQDWRGNLAPSDRTALQRAYQDLMTHLARLAQKNGVEVLSVGSELSSLDVDPDWFRPVVASVRRYYKGVLTYSANWDHYDKSRIWDLVDQVGLCAYFEITSKETGATVSDMIAGWRVLRRKLDQWVAARHKKLLFTEVGYMSQQGAAHAPWNEGAMRRLDLEEQRRAYEAFIRVWNGDEHLAGAYFWNWYGWGGSKDRSYTPRRKPAVATLAWWYGGAVPKWWFPR
ncbi:MAG: hypothetical protein J7M25_15275 [Deltaproteobacteria bacterium]|nr:hypothetical protein [Deltaproteobacteria bacterium]